MSIVKRWIQASSSAAIPLQASVELTHLCNLRCPHCYIDYHGDQVEKRLGLSQWKSILDQLREAGTLYLNLLGGEPFLYPDVYELCQYAARSGFFVTLTTNGLLLSQRELIQRLKDIGVAGIAFSLYSLNPSVHEKMTGAQGEHQNLVKTIVYAKELIGNVSINCLLTAQNIDGAIDLARWALSKEIEFRFDPQITRTFEGNENPTKLSASHEQLDHFYRQLREQWSESEVAPVTLREEDHICNVARGKCSIDPYGNLLGCVEMRTVLGNLVIDTFSDVWNGAIANKIRSFKNKDIVGDSSFGIHCPGMALKETGSPFLRTQKSQEISQIRQAIWKG